MGPRAAVALCAALIVAPLACTARFEVDGARAHARVVRQVEAGPRIPGTPGHEAVRAWLVAELERLGARVEQHQVVDSTLGPPLALTNVIGRYGPESGPRILLLAHWDTRPWCDQDPDSSFHDDPVPGANDAGSGVAVLFEVAELMSRRAPRVGVDLVFLDGEDQGRATRPEEFSLGARAYVARLVSRPDERAAIRGVVLFDMVGDKDLGIHPEVQAAERAANLVAIVLEGARATGASQFHATPRFEVTDDHIPFLQAGIPAVDVIDFDYPAWHTHRDTPDQVSPESLAEVSRVAAWIVYRSALATP